MARQQTENTRKLGMTIHLFRYNSFLQTILQSEIITNFAPDNILMTNR